ncbi:MAG: hypothetical protein NT047_17960 [Deltaproteobacteria bacterium]|nr:hypothetical protein [Deltaproteobacteria bacterium]
MTERQADPANLPANEDDFTSFTRLGPLPNHPEFIFPKERPRIPHRITEWSKMT